MKARYTKPVLMMESFTLSQSIAHNCSKQLDFGQANTKYKSTCGWNTMLPNDDNTGTIVVFTSEENGCNMVLTSGGDFMGICYNNPDGGIAVFNS